MSVSYSNLPYSVQVLIAQKLKVSDLAVFEQCSELALNRTKVAKNLHILPAEKSETLYFYYNKNEICFNFGILRPAYERELRKHKRFADLSQTQFHAREIVFNTNIDDNFCSTLLEYFENSGSTTKEFVLTNFAGHTGQLGCDGRILMKLMEVAKVEHFQSKVSGMGEFLKMVPDSVAKMSGRIYLDDVELFKRNVIDMKVLGTDVTNEGLFRLIEHFNEGKVDIKYLCLTGRDLSLNAILGGISEDEVSQVDVRNLKGQWLRLKISRAIYYYSTSLQNGEWFSFEATPFELENSVTY